jgi:hypothetical protein
MDAAEGEQHGPTVEHDRVLATYQHIRERWGLKNADTARMKAKRAGWSQLPKNSPGDMTRLIVPREQWDAVGDRSRGTLHVLIGEKRWGNGSETAPRPSIVPEAILTALLGKLEEREVAELREARALADQRAVELAELRERVGRAEAERDQARAERERAERQVAEVQAELAGWTAGGPLARAVRAFLNRRGQVL